MFRPEPVVSVASIPNAWMLETYFGLEGQLSGQTIRMESPFRPDSTHKDPLVFYFDRDLQDYRFKCWSSGERGRIVNVLMQIWNKSFREAASQVETDYKAYLVAGNKPKTLLQVMPHRWRVVGHSKRKWNTDDKAFWPRYHIDSKLLERDFVFPLESYSMLKFLGEEGTEHGFRVADRWVYGYFTPEGKLYKIYQPFNREQKYLKVDDGYIQGEGTLQGHPYLGIVSGMKDMLALKSLKLNVDFLAPDSENNLLDFSDLEAIQISYNYQGIFSLLDLDQCGLDNMRAYQELYGIPACPLQMGKSIELAQKKDAALCLKNFGPDKVKEILSPSIHRAVQRFDGLHNHLSTYGTRS